MEYLNNCKGINRAWTNITENIKTSAEESVGLYELKQYETWFDAECSRCLVKGSRLKRSSYSNPI
jgi:hypothetical protein